MAYELKKQNILIVDDMRENLDVLFGILRDEYMVSMAKSGMQALTITKKIVPDLIYWTS